MNPTPIVLTPTGFTADTDPDPLPPVEPGYPVTIRWPDGCEERYYTRRMLAYAVHTRTLLAECGKVGGVVSLHVQTE